jgi:hypothetical protein
MRSPVSAARKPPREEGAERRRERSNATRIVASISAPILTTRIAPIAAAKLASTNRLSEKAAARLRTIFAALRIGASRIGDLSAGGDFQFPPDRKDSTFSVFLKELASACAERPGFPWLSRKSEDRGARSAASADGGCAALPTKIGKYR